MIYPFYYNSAMKIKDILINIDMVRTFLFTNLLILYVYLQIIFLFIYSYLDKHSLHLYAKYSAEASFDFGVTFVSLLIFLFMICFCSIMTFLEYLMRKKISLYFLNIKNFPKLINIIHFVLFYFGLVIIICYILILLFLYFNLY